jgi:hypothetical protein
VLKSNQKRSVAAVALLMFAGAASAQTTATPTRLERALTHVDLGVSGIFQFTKGISGKVNNSAADIPSTNNQTASSSAGVLATLRAQKSPYVGIEVNYAFYRATQTYDCNPRSCNQVQTGNQISTGPLFVQANVHEYTIGYVARPPHQVFGLDPYLAVGGGALQFKPTTYGGNSLLAHAQGTAYYDVGVETLFTQHLGVRGGFRQQIYRAPDFDQSYLRTDKRTLTSEPHVGIYLRF